MAIPTKLYDDTLKIYAYGDYMVKSEKFIVYIGDFDFRNENVQSFLVRNNGKILNSLGFHIAFIGINTKETDDRKIKCLPSVGTENGDLYYELPNTLNGKGVFGYFRTVKSIKAYLDSLMARGKVEYLISYQSPTYSIVLKKIAKWCKRNSIKYIVNCADLPIFDLQPFLRRLVMRVNWNYMHRINKRYADGIISVSRFIETFYYKKGRPSVIIPPLFDESKYTYKAPKSNDVPSFIYAGIPFKITGNVASVIGMKDRLDYIIDLFLFLSKKSIPYSFTVIGITKENYLSSVPRHKDALAKESKIVFSDRHKHSDTLAMIAESDFSINYRDVNLMTKAGFSTKIVESVSVGTPVIINRNSDIFDYLKEGVSAFELTGNPEMDVSKISTVCSLSAESRILIKRNLYKDKIFNINKFLLPMRNFMALLNGSEN